jgi:hypothetical protein
MNTIDIIITMTKEDFEAITKNYEKMEYTKRGTLNKAGRKVVELCEKYNMTLEAFEDWMF